MPCGVLIAPVLPGLSDGDDQVRAVVAASLDAGAVSVAAVPLHLRRGVKDHYLGWLAKARPDLLPRHERLFARGAYQPEPERSRIARLATSVLRDRSDPNRAKPGERQWRNAVEFDHDEKRDGTDQNSGTCARGGGVPVQLRLMR